MTANFDLSREVYLYAQALDNQGSSEYWRVSEGGPNFELLPQDDERLVAIRDAIDRLQATGRSWSIAAGNLACYVTWRGDCVITIRPLTHDVAGRVSPVLLLLNVLAPSRSLGTQAWAGIPTYMQRELLPDDQTSLARLAKILSWPRWVLFLHIFLFSRSIGND